MEWKTKEESIHEIGSFLPATLSRMVPQKAA